MDRFYFNVPELTIGSVDRITDFNHSADTIYLSKSAFSTIARGTLKAASFVLGPTAQDAGDRILYNKADGSLYYDADGTGSAAAAKFASVAAGVILNASDIIIY